MTTFKDYQSQAAETDETSSGTVALYGLISEVGSIFSVFKKLEREKLPNDQFQKQLKEEIGDNLWYLSNLASLNGLDLEEIANENIDKAHNLFDPGDDSYFDGDFPENEQLPRTGEFTFQLTDDGNTSSLLFEGKQCGKPIRDNAPIEDHYRFHDVFHLAYMAVLGWSPVLRSLLARKRKSSWKKQLQQSHSRFQKSTVGSGK